MKRLFLIALFTVTGSLSASELSISRSNPILMKLPDHIRKAAEEAPGLQFALWHLFFIAATKQVIANFLHEEYQHDKSGHSMSKWYSMSSYPRMTPMEFLKAVQADLKYCPLQKNELLQFQEYAASGKIPGQLTPVSKQDLPEEIILAEIITQYILKKEIGTDFSSCLDTEELQELKLWVDELKDLKETRV